MSWCAQSCCSVSVSGREVKNEGIGEGCLLTSEEISNSAAQTLLALISLREEQPLNQRSHLQERQKRCVNTFSGVCGEIIQHMLILVLINNCNYRPCQILDQQGMVDCEVKSEKRLDDRTRLDKQNHTSPITGSCQVLTASSVDKKKFTHGRFHKGNVKVFQKVIQ